MSDRIEAMFNVGFGNRVLVTMDASVFVSPAKFQYDRDNTYFYRTFYPKLQARLGKAEAQMVVRDNAVKAFRRGSKVK